MGNKIRWIYSYRMNEFIYRSFQLKQVIIMLFPAHCPEI